MIDAVDKLADYVILKNIVILIICVIKDDAKFYPQIFLEETLYNEKAQRKTLKKDKRKIIAYSVACQKIVALLYV